MSGRKESPTLLQEEPPAYGPHDGPFRLHLIAEDFSRRYVGNLLETRAVAKRIQSCKSRRVDWFVREELSNLRSDVRRILIP